MGVAKNDKREAVLQALQAKAGLFGKKKMIMLGQEKAAGRPDRDGLLGGAIGQASRS